MEAVGRSGAFSTLAPFTWQGGVLSDHLVGHSGFYDRGEQPVSLCRSSGVGVSDALVPFPHIGRRQAAQGRRPKGREHMLVEQIAVQLAGALGEIGPPGQPAGSELPNRDPARRGSITTPRSLLTWVVAA